ncbi:MAG: hypothetical protein LBR65_00075 [Culturomica sp.]|jgi:Leucine-rich repeat (LRR) protein|nr:hypothetical protein [Culturomica sp.]
MKRNGYIWAIALLATAALGCSDRDDSLDKFVSDRLELTNTEVILTAAGGRSENTVITSDLPWTLEGGGDWCRAEPMSGTAGTATIYFTPDPNPEYDDRSVIFTLVAGSKRIPLTVYQKKKDALTFDKNVFDHIAMEGDTITIDMMTNVDYTIDIPGTSAGWIEHLPASGPAVRGLEAKSEKFRIAETDEWDERSGLIVFIREDEQTRDTVQVFQVQKDKIVLSPAILNLTLYGTEGMPDGMKVVLRSNIVYDIEVPAEYTEWLSCETTSMANEINVKVARTPDADTDETPRSGQILFKDRNNPNFSPVALQVNQMPKEVVNFVAATLEVERTAGSYAIDVMDNIDAPYELIIPAYATWIKKGPESRAMEQSQVTIQVAENPEGQIARKALLYLRSTVDTTLICEKPLTVVQKGRPVEPNDIETLKSMQAFIGFKHTNWWGGTGTAINYMGATISNRVTEKLGNVTVTIGGTVTALDFPNSSGLLSAVYEKEKIELPDNIGDLQNLTTLALDGHFTGDVPKSIASLSKLTRLTFSNQNQAADKSLNRLPQELGGLQALTTLTISHDFARSGQNLAGMLDFIGDLENLTTLEITNCNYGIPMPASWSKLKKLTKLTLTGTGFTDVSALSGMVSLNTLSITGSAITDLPDLSQLTKLTSVTLTNCPQLTQIPASLMKCPSLTSLTMGTNRLEALPEDWSGWVNLTTFNISNPADNSSSIVEEDREYLDAEKKTWRYKYKITGELPAGMGALTKLTSLNVSNNAFSGQIPSSLGNLTAIGTFNIQNNKFRSIAPGVVSKFTKITRLNLNDNQFEALPGDVVQMTWLTSLEAVNNEFTDPLPADIGNLVKLTTLNLSRDTNRTFKSPGLTGDIPESIGKLTVLGTLNLSNNDLSGSIPETFGNLGVAGTINVNLSYNRLTGPIPVSFMKLGQSGTGFKYIYLKNNELNGYIPDAFRNMKQIYKLDLRNNNFIGNLPEGIVVGLLANNNATELHVSGNRLKGVVPKAVKDAMAARPYTIPWQIYEQQPGYGLTAE